MTVSDRLEAFEEVLGTILAAVTALPSGDVETRLGKLELLTDRMEAGMANWKAEMSRLASRIEKQAYRAERAREQEPPSPPEPEPEPLTANDRILARRKPLAISQ